MDLLLPAAEPDVSDDRILELYGRPEGGWLRVNFVESLDGAATRDGVSGPLGPPGDQRVFGLLRRLADAVLVGAGTVRAEGYEALRLDQASVAWRRERGLAGHPVPAIVSARLDLDPASALFAGAPVRPIVLTTADSPVARREALGRVADVLVAGGTALDVGEARRLLGERGLAQVLCEGGPRLFGAAVAGDVVDELCLTLSPTIEAGDARRIASGPVAAPRPMRLAHALIERDALLLSYRRA